MFKFIKSNFWRRNWFFRHWKHRQEIFYKKNRWHFILDLSGVVIIIILLIATISLHFYRLDSSKIINQPLPPRLELDLNNPPLSVDFLVSSPSLSLADGTELKVTLINSGNFLIKDLKINLLALENNFSVDRIESVAEQNNSSVLKINNKQLIIDSLGIGEKRQVDIKVYFKSKDLSSRVIKWQAQTEYSTGGQIVRSSVNLSDLFLNAELSAQAAVYYNSPQGDELGSGPLPPLIGLPTNYWIFFDVKSAGDFKNSVFSAKLPRGVELTDRRSLLSGDFKYNTSSRQVVWTIPELKNQKDDYRVSFEVQFIPTEDQFEKTAIILDNIKCYAYDSLTGKENYKELDSLDTNLDFDRINKGSGEIGRP